MSTKKKDATTEQEDTLQSAMELLEKEKNISADVLYDAIEQALTTACEKTFNGRMDNIHVEVDREHCKYRVYADKTIVETDDDVMDPQEDISLREARERHIDGEIGDMVQVDINSRGFGRIATTIAKGVILQKIREEERNSVLSYYSKLEKTVVIGTVERQVAKTYVISLGRSEGVLNEKEQVPGETLRVGDHVKVYILGVHRTPKGGPKIQLSRTHPDMVRRMFEEEVSEIRDGTVEIKSIAREAGSRTKIAVVSNNPNVDPIGACVGLNGARVNTIVDELGGEKIDIVNWDPNPGNFIQNALSPAKIVAVFADPDEKSAKVVVPDYQLSLAIGKEGQNARLAAKLTGYKIDIKNETQAKDTPGFRYEDYVSDDDEEFEYVDENGNPVDQYGNPLDENGNPILEGETEPEEAEEAPAENEEVSSEEAPKEQPSEQ